MKSVSVLGVTTLVTCFVALTAFAPNTFSQSWTGAVSTNWNTAGNWSPLGVPGPGSNVTLDNGGASNQPVLDLGNSATIGGLAISAGTLTINGDLTSLSTISIAESGNLNVGAVGSLVGSVSKNGTGTFNLSSGSIAGNVSVLGGMFNRATGSISGNVDISGGTFNGGTGTLDIANLVVSDGTFNLNSSSITVDISVLGGVFNRATGSISGNIEISGGTFNGGTGTLDIPNLTINGGTFNSTTGNLLIAGNLSGTGGTFNPNNGTVVFDSLANSLIDHAGTLTFNNLQINKSSNTATVSVAAGQTKAVNGTLTLANGQLAGAGTLDATGPISVAALDGGNGNLLVSGNAARAFSISAPSSTFPAVLPNVTLNAPNTTLTSTGSGNVSFSSLLLQNVGSVTFGTPIVVSAGSFNNSSGTTITFNGPFTQSGGTFTGGSSNIEFNADFTLSNGTFNATSSNTFIGISFVILGGTFNHNSGTIVVDNATVSATSFNAFNFIINTPLSGGFSASGAIVTVVGTLNLINGLHGSGTLNAQGNFNVSSTFSGGTGAVAFTGNANQTYTNNGGANPRGVWTLNKPGGTVSIGSNLDISNGTSNFNLVEGTFTTGTNVLITGTRNVNRTSGFVVGNLRRTYSAAGSRVYDVGTASGYLPATLITTAGTFGTGTTVTVSANNGALPGSAPSLSLTRHWTITPSAGGITQADLTFSYLDGDVPGTASESFFRVLRRTAGSTSSQGGTINTALNTATVTGVTQFSDWGVGLVAPTAAAVTISGRVMTADGRGIGRTVVTLNGPTGVVATAITNPFGYYRFNAEAGAGYVVSVSSKSHTFAESSIVINPTDNVTNVNFISEPNSAASGRSRHR